MKRSIDQDENITTKQYTAVNPYILVPWDILPTYKGMFYEGEIM